MACNKPIRTPVGADYSFSKKKTEYRRGHSLVMLSRSEASRGHKRDRPFAAAQSDT